VRCGLSPLVGAAGVDIVDGTVGLLLGRCADDAGHGRADGLGYVVGGIDDGRIVRRPSLIGLVAATEEAADLAADQIDGGREGVVQGGRGLSRLRLDVSWPPAGPSAGGDCPVSPTSNRSFIDRPSEVNPSATSFHASFIGSFMPVSFPG
jgi:hypothetical protein